MIIFVIIGLVLGAVAVVFALQNTVAITVTFLLWQFNASLAVVLVLAILSGMIASFLVSIPEIVGDYFKFKNVLQEKQRLQQELDSYKEMVINLNAQILANSSKINNY
jgi:lipopolysaccharide assembly protein A